MLLSFDLTAKLSFLFSGKSPLKLPLNLTLSPVSKSLYISEFRVIVLFVKFIGGSALKLISKEPELLKVLWIP